MTLRHLQIFIAVCDKMNMTAAANTLYVSQSAVSQAIAELEAHYGIRLFERLSRKLYLTRAGEKLLGYARHILRMYSDAESEMRAMHETGLIRVGASVTIGATVLPKLAAAFQLQTPGARMEVVEDNTTKIEGMLLVDHLDLGLVEGDVTQTDLVCKPFAEDTLVCICGQGHPFWERESVGAKELEGENFILREAGSGTRNTFEEVMSGHGLSWTATWTCNNADTIKMAVAEGLGISVISQRAVHMEVDTGLLRTVKVEGLSFRRQFKLAYHKHKFLTDAMESFIRYCFAHSGQEGQ
ncbi:LysR family transcriptional regulator [Paenibacillus sp. J5C_2022]|uniref:LysR family transcriptional regulator n=1 Tax=Paenibacillus sp. J5C2022 TaxID=2977129 RepID=UPI0021D3562A|nr:LysR family transcriptional regulator [Paenibacillus sp. J5C2022]MCU6708799.1 LysR family transcriptional regulator [Paenibacillus sp. J5C2022]